MKLGRPCSPFSTIKNYETSRDSCPEIVLHQNKKYIYMNSGIVIDILGVCYVLLCRGKKYECFAWLIASRKRIGFLFNIFQNYTFRNIQNIPKWFSWIRIVWSFSLSMSFLLVQKFPQSPIVVGHHALIPEFLFLGKNKNFCIINGLAHGC